MNPYLIGMPIGSVALIVVGFIMVQANRVGDSMFDDGSLGWQIVGAGMINFGGLLAIASLVVGALLWKPTPPAPKKAPEAPGVSA